ncbi:rab11 family-interacting protein 5 isoform X2 [Mixophyes fleayi]|uniref:rab11 family-interacting protein 5 isoform X2 n=1 Tax=Mixophyes fleayi TaxID=3061075 RepID=UPI003F4E4527
MGPGRTSQATRVLWSPQLKCLQALRREGRLAAGLVLKKPRRPHRNQEDQKVYSFQEESGCLEAFAECQDFRLAQSSSSAPPVIASKLEEQFDAFASSRLQPVSNYQRPPETKAKSEEHLLPSSSNVQGTVIKMEYQTHNEDKLHNLHSRNPNSQVLDTCWPGISDINTRKTNEVSPLPESLSYNISPVGISTIESVRTQVFAKDLNTNKLNSYVPDRSEHVFQGTSMNVDLPLPESSATSHISVETSHTEIKMAAISPRVVKDENMISLEEKFSDSLSRQDSPTQRKHPTSMTPIDKNALDLTESSNDIVENMQTSIEFKEQASVKHNFDRVGFTLDQEVMHNEKTLVEERIKELIKEQAISEHVGSGAPPKPPRLMLPPVLEQMETYDDNCTQTSNQDTTGKQMESPEDRVQHQNMGDNKQTVSPVASCPVIEIQSPMLASIRQDTQSSTEGLLTNLGEGNNDVSAANGEHLLDVNEITASEQFRTCPLNVSLDTDLSSPHETSNKLHLINHGPSEQLSTLGHSKQDKEGFIFRKPILLSKKPKESRSEISSVSKKHDQSDLLFWSALEEQVPSSIVNSANAKQDLSMSQCANVLPDCRDFNSPNSQCSSKQGQYKDKHEGIVNQMVESNSPPPKELSDHKFESSVKALKEESQSVFLLSQQSSWSADIIVDFKNEDFWRTEPDQLDTNQIKSFPSPGNPFTPTDRSPLSHKNPFIEHSSNSRSSESSLPEDMSFKDLHACAALGDLPSAVQPVEVKDPITHGSQPLAFSTPSLNAAQNPKPSNFPSPIMFSTTSEVTTTTDTHTATLSCCHSTVAGGGTSFVSSVLPQETQSADNPFMPLRTSPHPVKPISAAPSETAPEKKTHRPALTTALSSGLGILKSVTGGQHSTPKKQEQERLKDLCHPDLAAKYYHLTHDELIQMLLQREAELGKQEDRVHELENYIDKLLVRIMEQAPALLQAPLETKK